MRRNRHQVDTLRVIHILQGIPHAEPLRSPARPRLLANVGICISSVDRHIPIDDDDICCLPGTRYSRIRRLDGWGDGLLDEVRNSAARTPDTIPAIAPAPPSAVQRIPA